MCWWVLVSIPVSIDFNKGLKLVILFIVSIGVQYHAFETLPPIKKEGGYLKSIPL